MMMRAGNRCMPAIGLLPAVVLLMLGGCMSSDPTDGLALTAYGPTVGAAGHARALVALPAGAGRILSVSESVDGETLTQRIVLEGDGGYRGENLITIERGGGGSVARHLLRPPTAEVVGQEMRRWQPDLRFRISATTETNGVGPFGTAYAKIGDGTCLYAWQWSDGKRTTALGFQRVRPVSIRVKLCRTASVEDLVALVRQLAVSASGGAALGKQHGSDDAFKPDALQLASARLGLPTPVAPEMIEESSRKELVEERRIRRKQIATKASVRQKSAAPTTAIIEGQPVIPQAPSLAGGNEADAFRRAEVPVPAPTATANSGPTIPMP